jgi:hypothetical protein
VGTFWHNIAGVDLRNEAADDSGSNRFIDRYVGLRLLAVRAGNGEEEQGLEQQQTPERRPTIVI